MITFQHCSVDSSIMSLKVVAQHTKYLETLSLLKMYYFVVLIDRNSWF